MAEIEVDRAEKAIADLRKTVSTLESDVAQLSSSYSTHPPNAAEDPDMKKRKTSELITQALLKVDSIQISKDLAADLLRMGQRDKSRKVAILLARRKTIVKKLNAMGDTVDKLALVNEKQESTSSAPSNKNNNEEEEEEEEEKDNNMKDVQPSLSAEDTPTTTATTTTTTATAAATTAATTN